MSPVCGVIRRFERMVKDPTEPTWPYIFLAELANHRFVDKPDPEQASSTGKGTTVDRARAGALGEAVERYSATCWDYESIVYSPRRDLETESLDPRQLVLYQPWQYDELPYAPYSDAATLGWVPARSLVRGAEVLVPAVASFMGYQRGTRHEFLFPPTSNGLATGPTPLDAVLAGLVEVLERDAFLVAWMNRLPSARVDPWGHPDRDLVELCALYDRRGVELRLNRLPTDHPCHVFLATGLQRDGGDGPAAVIGLGADPDPARAARKAVLEVGQIRPGLRASLRRPETRARLEELVEDPQRVADLDDHDLLYADPRSLDRLAFLLDRPVEGIDWQPRTPPPPAGALVELVEHFGATGGDVLSCDLTAPDMAALGLYTARVIVPGFQPMHFGAKEARLGAERLYQLPHRLGLAAEPSTPATLNPDPHPLA